MSVSYGEITRVLAGARRRQVWVVLVAAATFGAAGVVLFLNFVPKRLSSPPGGHVEYIDIAAKLEKLSFIGRNR